jgi:histidinol-phosphate phosphatase family protein
MATVKRNVLFLDRDGVINKYPGDGKYVVSWKGFVFLPRVKSALQRLIGAGYKIFVISNQAGVSKGIFTQRSLDTITKNMLYGLKKAGIFIDGVYYCVHRSEDKCSCRKPKVGMLRRALKEHKLAAGKLGDCFFVGDTIRDIQTGKRAHCKTILVFSGKEKPKNKALWELDPDYTARDLFDAVSLILGSGPVKAGARPRCLSRLP